MLSNKMREDTKERKIRDLGGNWVQIRLIPRMSAAQHVLRAKSFRGIKNSYVKDIVITIF